MKNLRFLKLRVVFALVLALSTLGISTSAALADKPAKFNYTGAADVDLDDVCTFSIHLFSDMTSKETDFFDQNGALTRIFIHVVAQDTISANGKELVGIPYAYNLVFLFDSSGNLTNFYAEGVVEKIRLPDGSLFVSAGWTDVLTLPTGFTIVPTLGRSGNVAGLCAALS